MHELSIAIAILEEMEEESRRNGYGSIEAIHVKVGKFSGVVPQALRSAYELAAETLCVRTRLVIEEIPVTIYCEACGRNQPIVSEQSIQCAACGAPGTQIASGRELELSALELAP